MNNSTRKNNSVISAEKKSEKLLLKKMGLSQKEFREIRLKYGVNASRLIELMQLSKYQFIYTGKAPGQCEPCMMIRRFAVENF